MEIKYKMGKCLSDNQVEKFHTDGFLSPISVFSINEALELKEKLEKYGVKVHFACANDDETRGYDMSEIDDPSLVEAFMADEEVIKLRTEAGVNLSSAEMLSTVDKFKIW